MAKPRLIKKQNVTDSEQANQQDSKQQKVVKKTVNIVVEWLENQRSQNKDPRKAFAALFAQPQE